MTITGKWGEQRCDDGESRSFGGTDARSVIAETLARREGWAEIRPGHWRHAGAVAAALRDAGLLLTPSVRLTARQLHALRAAMVDAEMYDEDDQSVRRRKLIAQRDAGWRKVLVALRPK